jgi:hypothetical protein
MKRTLDHVADNAGVVTGQAGNAPWHDTRVVLTISIDGDAGAIFNPQT